LFLCIQLREVEIYVSKNNLQVYKFNSMESSIFPLSNYIKIAFFKITIFN